MLNTATKSEAPGTEQELTDGFHLVIDALKLNGINTIYNVPGIPITDLGRMAQAAGIRMISFRHEQNAGMRRASPASSPRSPASASRSPRPASSTVSPRSRTPPPTATR